MKKIILLWIAILCIVNTNAQTGNRDSIKQLLQNDKEDTNRVLHLADLSFEYIESNPDTMMTLALQALELSRRIHFLKGEAISLNRVSNAYNGNYAKSMEVLLQALQINEKINNLDGISRNYNNIGGIYFAEEDYRQALDYYFKAKLLAEQINNNRSISSACANIASVYDSLKIYDSARLYAQQTYDTAYKINYYRLVGSSLHILGHIHFMTGQNNSALEFYRLSIPYSKEAKNDLRLSQTYLNLAKVFQKTNQTDSVLFYAKQSLLLARERGFTPEVRNAARFLSYYYRKVSADSAFFYQDISKAANDSLFSQQKQKQFQTLAFDEKLRQQELETKKIKEEEERKHNLQDAIIIICLITFVILFLLLSRSIIVKAK
ncbi:MAG: hypothetical protein M3004_04385, partial [Bacteroidota bacterium]|nr:hypothetical protein [Bacteroidota bacterium]